MRDKLPTPYYQTANAQLYHGDCLDILQEIDTSSVHMILTDLPYEVTECEWDTVIKYPQLWSQLERVIIDPGAMLFTTIQPFTTQLIQSNISNFKYEYIWVKNKPTGFLHAKNRPMRRHESVLVFSRGSVNHKSLNNTTVPYYPQGLEKLDIAKNKVRKNESKSAIPYRPSHGPHTQDATGYPDTILKYDAATNGYHPTEKPVDLFEYLIKTYTLEGQTVLDATCGSGTTLVAALKNKRKCIGIEQEQKYCDTTIRRIEIYEPQPKKKYNVTRG